MGVECWGVQWFYLLVVDLICHSHFTSEAMAASVFIIYFFSRDPESVSRTTCLIPQTLLVPQQPKSPLFSPHFF